MIDVNNPVIQLCMEGTSAEFRGQIDEARSCYQQAWELVNVITIWLPGWELATPAVVEGIRELIAGFNGESPGGGYYGKQKGRINGWDVDLPDDNSFPLKTMYGYEVVIDLVENMQKRKLFAENFRYLM